MPSFFYALAGLATLTLHVAAHMQLFYPAPFNASNNPYRETAADPYLQYPYDCCGPNDRWMYPCRGYQTLLGTPQGSPTAEWAAGSLQNWSVTGIGNHYGGSCQVGFSTDLGSTFHVVTSYEGDCPHRNNGDGPDGQIFPFTVPEDLETGVQIFAWVWYNREQELNMNCAAVTITTSQITARDVKPLTPAATKLLTSVLPHTHEKRPEATEAVHRKHGSHKHSTEHLSMVPRSPDSGSSSSIAFADRPLMLVADNGNGCETPHTTAELQYPDPGPDVVLGDGVYPLAYPIGSCSQTEMLAQQAYHGENGNDGHFGA